MITLRQLRYLSALAKHGHFGRAAEACAVTQPALSMQIRDLERTLGVAVVERRPGEVMLTEVGLEIARRGEDVLSASRDLVDFARQRSGLLTGRLTLGVIPSLAPYLLPRFSPSCKAGSRNCGSSCGKPRPGNWSRTSKAARSMRQC
jgi:LysR family hydrogen peroxide-inducible transcriptional activator